MMDLLHLLKPWGFKAEENTVRLRYDVKTLQRAMDYQQ